MLEAVLVVVHAAVCSNRSSASENMESAIQPHASETMESAIQPHASESVEGVPEAINERCEVASAALVNSRLCCFTGEEFRQIT